MLVKPNQSAPLLLSSSLHHHGNSSRGNSELDLSCLASFRTQDSLLNMVRLRRDELFGVTTIIGGTNVRFSVSLPGWVEPVVYCVTWDEVRGPLSISSNPSGYSCDEAKAAVFTELAHRFLNFLGTISPDDGLPPPINLMGAFNVSVAGIVDGKGLNALVTTANTGVPIRGEPIARYLTDAIGHELSLRGWGQFSFDSTTVMNDAVAGALGEYTLGGLRGYGTSLYLIIGTGVGSMGILGGEPYFRYSQMGQNITYNSFTKTFRVKEGTDVLTTIDAEGNFKEPPLGEHYLENYLGGPWLATRFVKQLCGDYALHPLMYELADRLTPHVAEEDRKDILPKLIALGELSSRTRHKWATLAPSDLVKGINTILLDQSLPLATQTSATSTRTFSRGLNTYASKYKRSYFEDIGRAIGALVTKMGNDRCSPQKIVIGGGIGEACGRYPSHQQSELRETIQRHAGTSQDLIIFSMMSAEARESAVTTHTINEGMRRKRSNSTPRLYC